MSYEQLKDWQVTRHSLVKRANKYYGTNDGVDVLVSAYVKGYMRYQQDLHLPVKDRPSYSYMEGGQLKSEYSDDFVDGYRAGYSDHCKDLGLESKVPVVIISRQQYFKLREAYLLSKHAP